MSDDVDKKAAAFADCLSIGINEIHAVSGKTKTRIEGDLTESLGVSPDTLRGWRKKRSRPGDDAIKSRLLRLMVSSAQGQLTEEWARSFLWSVDYDDGLTEDLVASIFPKPGAHIPAARCQSFFGRDEFVADTLGILEEPRRHTITIIGGDPGYGKTEAGRRVAVDALDQGLFDEVAWIVARKSEYLYGLEVEERPEDLLALSGAMNELALQLRCAVDDVQYVLNKKRTLVVIDNAETADLARILPRLSKMMRNGHVLLTSRQVMSASDIRLLSIAGLNLEWSKKLLLEESAWRYRDLGAIERATSDQFEEIHALTRGAPLALHFVVSRVHFDRELAPVLTDLREANKSVESFYRFCYETAWRRISDNARLVLRNIGYLHNASVNREQLPDLCDLPEAVVRDSLAELQRWYLVEQPRSRGVTYRVDLHPWVRSIVRSRMVDEWPVSQSEIKRLVQLHQNKIEQWKHNQP